jgi:two-component system, chemotaxis family, chemotaxis protein CheY
MKVLIVDDSNTMRRIIINAVANIKLNDTLQASNGSEAVEVVKTHPVDLVLMDWNMPVMSGIDALRLIRSLEYKMPIIMVTTEAEKDRVIEAIKAGANNYIIKPFTAQAVCGKIQETMLRAGVQV